MTTKPNTVLWTTLALAGTAALGALILAAEKHGKRRQQKQTWRYDPCGSPTARRAS